MKKILLLTIIAILLNSCIEIEGDPILRDTSSICSSELSVYYGKRTSCTREDILEDYRECDIYEEYNYTDEELRKSNLCMSSLNCENVENTNSISEIDGCPTFRDKPIKSKEKICSENYQLFCQHLNSCNKELTDPCEDAKYISTNNVGEDEHIDFKKDILIKYCTDEPNEDADIEDVCLARNVSCESSTLRTYLEDCRDN